MSLLQLLIPYRSPYFTISVSHPNPAPALPFPATSKLQRPIRKRKKKKNKEKGQTREHQLTLLRSFRNLSPKARIGVGLGLLVWGAVGLQLSDGAEERYFKPTEEDRAALRDIAPRITTVDRNSGVGDATTPSRRNGSAS
ncbi:hypothetical protein F4859DRAFT_165820 [Xylaria cf. heliscus]|nr:hypothetical protein F4859DRAFT_165820 [Xylaria cf. heliscus]